jgi:hypothetical protein
MTIRTSIILVAAFLLSPLLGEGAFAGSSWLCSINEAVAIDEDGTIGPPDLDGLARPTFLRVDTETMLVTLLAPPERSGETTKVDAVREGDGIWVFSGVEAGRAWSMVISKDGHMTLSVTGDGVTWSVFGNAMLDG